MTKALSTRVLDQRFITAVSIIVGTSIGAGMLGLPVETAKAGFLPTLCWFFITWIMTILTGFLFTEVIVSRPLGSNYISLGKSILGEKFTLVIFGLYILLFYSLIAAYTKGIGLILCKDLLVVKTVGSGSFFFMVAFLPLIYFGTKILGKVNNFLTLVLLASFLLLIFFGNQNLSFDFLKHQNWSQSLFSLPLMISSFGFHGTLPSLVDYLERDKRKIQWAIVLGSTVTLAIYISWELFILGSIPLHGEHSLTSAWENDQTAITPLSQISHHPMIWNLAHIFSLSAIITSFFGVSLGLMDFLIDALQLKKTFATKTTLLFIVYASALLLSMTELRIFYLSLNYGAGIAAVFLLIFLPAFMVFKSNSTSHEPLFFLPKKIALPAVFLFSALSIIGCLLSFIP